MQTTLQNWRLSKPGEKRFRTGHPWVFSNELVNSPKGVLAGELVRLLDQENKFLAIGYAHPNSVISLRVLSYIDTEINAEWFHQRITKAANLRSLSQVDRQGEKFVSNRLVFAEADQLPGLIIDRYPLASGESDVFVAQTSTSGMDKLWPEILNGLELFVKKSGRDWGKTVVVLANDSKSRLLENLKVEEKRIVHGPKDFNANDVDVLVQSSHPDAPPVKFKVDFIGGQKTGFFLDQRSNIQALSRLLPAFIASKKAGEKIRVLDLCCYVGQWGAQIANVCRQFGLEAEVTSVDSSAKALELARTNVVAAGGECHPIKADVLNGLDVIENGKFDIVICDPPAFIKKKKDIPTGQAAYVKMNRESLSKLARGGIYVSCSCSGLLAEEDFRNVLAKALSITRMHRNIRWIFRGFHSPDHPQRPEFPQGTYLKSWIGVYVE